MHLRRFFLLLLGIIFTTTATVARDLQSEKTCADRAADSILSNYLDGIPNTGGLRSCIALNANSILRYLLNSKTGCELQTITDLAVDTSSGFAKAVDALAGDLLTSDDSDSSVTETLEAWQKDTKRTADFCKTMNEKVMPCVQALLPALLSLAKQGADCCDGLVGYVEAAEIITPDGKSLETTLFDIINGFHRSFCSEVDDGFVCGDSIVDFLASEASDDDETIFGSMIARVGMPLYATTDKVCSALDDGKALPSRFSGSVPYFASSCCTSSMSSFLQSIDRVALQLSGDSLSDMLNVITNKMDSDVQFESMYSTISSCKFDQSCSNPSYTLSSKAPGRTSSSATAKKKTQVPQHIQCDEQDVCDSTKVCSSVCKEGTVEIAPWVSRAISYQLNQSYSYSLCYTQLPATHNSVITAASGFGNRDQLTNAKLNASDDTSYLLTSNQYLSVVDQLDLGARFLELDVHYFGGGFRNAHCSSLRMPFVSGVVSAMKDVLIDLTGDKSVEWDEALVGCVPSISGIRSEEQPKHKDNLEAIAKWLDDHPDDLIVLYTEIGDEIKELGRLDELLELHATVFGDLLLTPSDVEAKGGDWTAFTLQEMIDDDKRVIPVATPMGNGAMFSMREDLCDGFVSIPGSESPDDGSGATFYGQEMGAGTLVRAQKTHLHYAKFSEGELISGLKTLAQLTPATLPTYVNAGVNIIAPDGLDGSAMKAMVWSWAKDEPSNGDKIAYLSAKDGKWYGTPDAADISHKACVRSKDRSEWKVVDAGKDCGAGYAKGAPKLAIENQVLLQILKREGGDATAELEVDVESMPTISEEDQERFKDSNASGNTEEKNGGSGSDAANQHKAWSVAAIMLLALIAAAT